MNRINWKGTALVLFFIIYCAAASYAQNVRITIEVTNAIVNDGIVHVAIFFNADEYRREIPSIGLQIESTSTVVSREVTLPVGEYLISAYQDSNGNNRMDYRVFGIPRELVAMTNYFGRGFPSRNFNRQKIPVTESTSKVSIALFRF